MAEVTIIIRAYPDQVRQILDDPLCHSTWAGPGAWIPRVLVDPLLRARNTMALRRLRATVEHLAAAEAGEVPETTSQRRSLA